MLVRNRSEHVLKRCLVSQQPGLQKGFWESNDSVDPDLKLALDRDFARLRDVPESDLDWHPGSDEQVLDLIHPSM